jgi:hypothetical protein
MLMIFIKPKTDENQVKTGVIASKAKQAGRSGLALLFEEKEHNEHDEPRRAQRD